MEEDSAFGKIAGEEATTLMKLLETENRKVMVLVIGVEGDIVATCRRASDDTTRDHATAFLCALDSQRERIVAKMEKK